MTQLKPKKIEEHVVDILKSGSMNNLDLIALIKKRRPNTTKQAVYLALRMLKKDEKILTYKGMSSLDLTWLKKISNYFIEAKSNYLENDTGENNFLNLESGESINYYFNNIIKADYFWTHVFYLLLEKDKTKDPVFMYNPYEWFLLVRNENERDLIKDVIENRQIFFTIGSNLFLDKYVKKYFDNDLSQYHMLEKSMFENNYYINIIGDFLIEVWMDKETSNKIDNFYKKTNVWNEKKKIELEKIVSTEKRLRFKISNNPGKANKIKRSLKKYFYTTKEG